MLSNKETAAEVEKMMQRCSSILNNSIIRVMETWPDEEFKAYRRIIARNHGLDLPGRYATDSSALSGSGAGRAKTEKQRDVIERCYAIDKNR
jgi:hypothetical protein